LRVAFASRACVSEVWVWVDSTAAKYAAVVIFWQWGWLGCLLSALRACAPPGWRLAKNMYEDWRRVTSQRIRTMVHHIRTQLQYAKANPEVLCSDPSSFFLVTLCGGSQLISRLSFNTWFRSGTLDHVLMFSLLSLIARRCWRSLGRPRGAVQTSAGCAAPCSRPRRGAESRGGRVILVLVTTTTTTNTTTKTTKTTKTKTKTKTRRMSVCRRERCRGSMCW
jgi:hypothetical protein